MPKKFEYKVVRVEDHIHEDSITEVLNSWAEDGWELKAASKISHKHNGSFGDHWELIFERKL